MRKKTKTMAGEPIVLKKNIWTRVLYWVFMLSSFGTMVTSLIVFFVTEQGRETTFNQVFMSLLSLVSLNIPLLLERKFKVYIPNYITIVTYCLIFFHFILGEVYRAYDHVRIFDKVLHTTSGVIISLLSFSIISMLNNMQRTKVTLSPFFVVLFTFCFTMTSEYLWEIFEYSVDSLFGANMQRWQDSLVLESGAAMPPADAEGTFVINGPRGNGLIDTMGDMIVNIFGCLGVCIYAYIGMKVKPDWFKARVMLTKSDVEALAESGEVVLDETVADALGADTDPAFAAAAEFGADTVLPGQAADCAPDADTPPPAAGNAAETTAKTEAKTEAKTAVKTAAKEKTGKGKSGKRSENR